jgi:hypothetical protein
MLLQRGEDDAHMLQMLRPGVAIDEDVVEEDQDEAPEHVVHQRLESSRRVCQAERHDEELEEGLMCSERDLRYAGGVQKNLTITGPQVDLGEETCAAEFV